MLNEIMNYYAVKENLSQKFTDLCLMNITLILELTIPSFLGLCYFI